MDTPTTPGMTVAETNAIAQSAIPTEQSPVKTKRKYTKPTGKKAPAKTSTELESLDPKKMTDSEKNMYIAECRGVINKLSQQLTNMSETTTKVFERSNKVELEFAEFKSNVNKDMQLIRSAATLMAESIINHTYGGK